MTRTFVLALALLGLPALAPAEAACIDLECLAPIEVCQDLIPLACFEVDPQHVLDYTSLKELIQRLIGPCTCPPIQ